jgi:hypothetical protein
MTNEELIIVPVTLHPEEEESTLAIPPNSSVDAVYNEINQSRNFLL